MQLSQSIYWERLKVNNMNKVILMGRLTRDPEVRYSPDGSMTIARYSLAVDRRFKREGEADADFINCVAFGKQGEFAEKYLRKGMKIAVSGRLQTGSYTNREGQKVYTTDVVVEEHFFCESKSSNDSGQGERRDYVPSPTDNFMDIPNDIQEELPFV